jgi:hypothetical protein
MGLRKLLRRARRELRGGQVQSTTEWLLRGARARQAAAYSRINGHEIEARMNGGRVSAMFDEIRMAELFDPAYTPAESRYRPARLHGFHA